MMRKARRIRRLTSSAGHHWSQGDSPATTRSFSSVTFTAPSSSVLIAPDARQRKFSTSNVISRESEQRRKSRVQRLLKDSVAAEFQSEAVAGESDTAAFWAGKRTSWFSGILDRGRAIF
jgi:hypothetical protein